MHHPALLLIVLLLAILFGPLFAQGIDALGSFAVPAIAGLPGAAALSKLAAPALVGVIILLGVAVVAAMKLVIGV